MSCDLSGGRGKAGGGGPGWGWPRLGVGGGGAAEFKTNPLRQFALWLVCRSLQLCFLSPLARSQWLTCQGLWIKLHSVAKKGRGCLVWNSWHCPCYCRTCLLLVFSQLHSGADVRSFCGPSLPLSFRLILSWRNSVGFLMLLEGRAGMTVNIWSSEPGAYYR